MGKSVGDLFRWIRLSFRVWGLRLTGFGRSLVAHLRSLSDAEFGFCGAQAAKGFPVQGAG